MFYDLDVYIFYISDHKLGICLRILRLSKGLQHNWGYYVRTLLLICGGGYHEDDAQTFFFFSHPFPLVFVYLMCGMRQLSSSSVA